MLSTFYISTDKRKFALPVKYIGVPIEPNYAYVIKFDMKIYDFYFSSITKNINLIVLTLSPSTQYHSNINYIDIIIYDL